MDTPILRPYLKSISDAIRTKLGTTEKIKAEDFAEKILSIPTGSGDNFMDIHQDYGNRTEYNGAFSGRGWTTELLKFKYNIVPTNAYHMFYYNKHVRDIASLFYPTTSIIFDTSQCTNLDGFIQSADVVTHLPEISTISCKAINQFIHWNTLLKKVEKLILKSDGSQTFSNSFEGLMALEDILIEGKIGANINLSSSKKLKTASVVSIVEALYEGSSGKTLTLSKELVETKLEFPHTSAQSGITYNSWAELEGTKNNWNISLV